jgi:hypothetical protein
VLSTASFVRPYTNATFGFFAEMPVGKVSCTSKSDESDRGFVVLWNSKVCPPAEDAAGIYVHVEYNALGWRSTIEEGKSICENESARPSPFMVSGIRFYRCKSRTDQGHDSLSYFALRNKNLSSPDNGVSYEVTLICQEGNCRDLMPMTRWIFAHMKFIRQE